MMEIREHILSIFLADTSQFHDCFTLATDYGYDLHDVALAIVSITKEYETITKVEGVDFQREDAPRKIGAAKKDTEEFPVTFYRLTGRTWHETRKQGDNRHRYWRNILKTK